MNITMSQGSGGSDTSKLIEEVFREAFHNEYLDRMEDSSVVPGASRIALTTDSFVVQPVIYDGGNIGRLSVCGTVNDLLMSGAVPKYLTAGCVLEEGLDVEVLKEVVISMADTAREAGVQIVSGDTKVVEAPGNSREPGLIINTAGTGFVDPDTELSPGCIQPGDRIILSGDLGDHHLAIMKSRLNIRNVLIKSDNAPLNEMVRSLIDNGIRVRAMRDVTRGGLGTVLNEFVTSSGLEIRLKEEALPVKASVRDFCGLLGLDIMYLGNEGKMVCAVDPDDCGRALDIIRGSKYGERAALIGEAGDKKEGARLILETAIGGKRTVPPLYGEGLPRIC